MQPAIALTALCVAGAAVSGFKVTPEFQRSAYSARVFPGPQMSRAEATSAPMGLVTQSVQSDTYFWSEEVGAYYMHWLSAGNTWLDERDCLVCSLLVLAVILIANAHYM